MRFEPAILLIGATVFLAIGCTPKGGGSGSSGQTQPATGAEEGGIPKWFPHTVDVRVHPASRYVIEREALRLEARIELLDQFNEPIKDVGRLVVELRLLDANGRIIEDAQGRQRGFRWAFDLTTEPSQRELWDPIARAYVLPLKISDEDVPEFRTVLSVTFEPAWPGMPTLPRGDRARKPVEIRTDW